MEKHPIQEGISIIAHRLGRSVLTGLEYVDDGLDIFPDDEDHLGRGEE